jgi:hypothetical protein
MRDGGTMTREEAEQKLCHGKPCSLSVEAAKFVEWSHRLGMLYLDEPKSAEKIKILRVRGVWR